jgi:TonB-linked SusC/RagA family outer membrane protein
VNLVTPNGTLSPRNGTFPSRLSRRANFNQRQIINLFTSYEKQLGDHYLKGTAGLIQEFYDNLRITASNEYLYSDDILSLSATYGQRSSVGDLASQLAVRGVFGRINYNYKERYLVEINGRYDGTSRFLQNVRYKFYPGISAGWTVSKESFWEPLQTWFNFFKIRPSWGQQGSQSALGDAWYPFYPALRTVTPSSTSPTNNWLFNSGHEPYVTTWNMVDPSLTWVTTTSLNLGTDLAFLSNRLTFAFDWYKRSSLDDVGPPESQPAVFGVIEDYQPRTNNLASETTGFELNIGWKQQVGDFYYGIIGVLSDYKAVCLKFPNPSKALYRLDGFSPQWYEGRVFGEVWGYETVGLFKNEEDITASPSQELLYPSRPWTPGDVKYADIDGDGAVTFGKSTFYEPGDRRVIGNTTARYSFGLTLTADYKGFDFSIFLQGIGLRNSPANHYGGITTFGNMVWGIPRGGSEYQGMLYEIHQDRWSIYNPNRENAYWPKAYMSDQNRKNCEEQTRFLQNAAYMRVKNLQLGYSIPPSVLQKIYLQRARVFVNAENVATFTKMIKTLDPDFSSSDGKIYPLQRIYSFGLNVTF